MKSLLARIGLPQAIGLYVQEQAVHSSQVVATPFGPVEISRHSRGAGPDGLSGAIKQLLVAHLGRRGSRRVPVAIGLPAGRTFFSTRPVQVFNEDPSPHALLRETLRSRSVSVNEMVVDVIKSQPDKRPVASIVSCERGYLTGLVDALRACGVRRFRAEPAPCALLRTATTQHRAGNNAKVVLRLFLSDAEGLAVLTASNQPVVWRFFHLPRGDEASALLSTKRSLLAMSENCGIESPLGTVMLHGRKDLARLLDVDWMQQEMGVPLRWFDGPCLDGPQIAFGLAAGCLSDKETAFNLAEPLTPRVSFWELFPWRQAALQAAMLLCMAGLLADRCDSLNRSYKAVRTQNAQNPLTESTEVADLEKEKNDLQQKVAAVRKFLGTRVTWTAYERELARCLPENVYLTSFHAVSELEQSGKKRGNAKPKRSWVLQGAVANAEDGSVPDEIGRFIDTLREHPMLSRHFPVVTRLVRKQSERSDDEAPVTDFTVVCLPKVSSGAEK